MQPSPCSSTRSQPACPDARLRRTFAAILILLLQVSLHAARPETSASTAPNLVIVIGEDEYLTWETLPVFADTHLRPRPYHVQIVHQDPADKHQFPDLVQAVARADLLLLSIRRRALPKDQLNAIRQHLHAGKPLVAIRTSSHAFEVRGADRDALATDPNRTEWTRFDPEVLGGNYSGHFGSGVTTVIRPAPDAAGHPILAGLDLRNFESVASLYRTQPLAEGTALLLIGEIPGDRIEPIAWTHHYGPNQARVFYTSLGHAEDFRNPTFRQLLLNGIAWALGPARLEP
jgi:type 1 glutamine amidotransferase